MANIEKYNAAFIEVFGVTEEVLNESFSKRKYGRMGFCSSIEYNLYFRRIF